MRISWQPFSREVRRHHVIVVVHPVGVGRVVKAHRLERVQAFVDLQDAGRPPLGVVTRHNLQVLVRALHLLHQRGALANRLHGPKVQERQDHEAEQRAGAARAGAAKEAAELDGASGMFRFWKVTWPLIWSVRRIVVLHLVIAIMNTFALVRLMTDGGPDGATEVTLTYLYKRGFSPDSFYGEATAIGVVNFLVAMALAGIVILLFWRDPVEARK